MNAAILAFLLLCACPVLAVAQDLAEARVDPSYEGKYAYKTLLPFLNLFAREAPAAFRASCDALGVACDQGLRPLVRVRDAAVLEPARTIAPAAKTFAEKSGGGLRLVVLFHSEYLANGSGSPEKRLRHEMTHAAMRLALGDDRYARVPLWLREGVALAVADQGMDRVRYEFTIALDAGALLDGLDERHESRDYAEDFLAVDFLRRRAGKDALLVLMNGLLTGDEPMRAVERTAGVEAGAFEETFREETLPALEKQAKAELGRFEPAFGLFRDGRYEEALARFRADRGKAAQGAGLLAGSLEGKALYYEAKCLFQLGRAAEALPLFRAVRKRHVRSCGLADDAAFFEAECLLRLGDVASARAGFLLFVRDFPYSNFSEAGWHKRGLCAFLKGDFAEAKRVCLATHRAFPESPHAENALYDAANAARMLGERDEARRLFCAFLERYPESRFKELAEARLAALGDHEKE